MCCGWPYQACTSRPAIPLSHARAVFALNGARYAPIPCAMLQQPANVHAATTRATCFTHLFKTCVSSLVRSPHSIAAYVLCPWSAGSLLAVYGCVFAASPAAGLRPGQ